MLCKLLLDSKIFGVDKLSAALPVSCEYKSLLPSCSLKEVENSLERERAACCEQDVNMAAANLFNKFK